MIISYSERSICVHEWQDLQNLVLHQEQHHWSMSKIQASNRGMLSRFTNHLEQVQSSVRIRTGDFSPITCRRVLQSQNVMESTRFTICEWYFNTGATS